MSLNSSIEKIVKSHNANLYGTEIINELGSSIFRVYITKKGGVDLDLCAEISNELSPFLDVNPPVGGTYYLEVSSPGIERKLENSTHFMSAIGERVKFKINGANKAKGVIMSANNIGFEVEIKKEKHFFNYSDISKAKTYYEWNKS